MYIYVKMVNMIISNHRYFRLVSIYSLYTPILFIFKLDYSLHLHFSQRWALLDTYVISFSRACLLSMMLDSLV